MSLQRIALVGQPNSGKSTVFNFLAGYRAVASNFPGTTVDVLKGKALVAGRTVEIVDLPGTYSLISDDRAEQVTRDFLLSGGVDAVINIVDASLLSRSLELTLELIELGLPLVVCLNMMDEAEHKGIEIDVDRLSARLGVPVVASVAARGVGLKRLLALLPAARAARQIHYSADVEEALAELVRLIQPEELQSRYAAIRLLSGDPIAGVDPEAGKAIQNRLAAARGEDSALVLSAERHALAMTLFENVAQVGHARIGWRECLDGLLMHRFLAYPILALILFLLFFGVYKVGGFLEGIFLPPLMDATDALSGVIPGIAGDILTGAFQGLWAGVGIVLPYLVPFLFFLALLEDVGYLPRVGYLMDTIMHRVGLHGKSVIPFLLGYGCSVPAVLATRILEDERDRLVTSALAVMVPCAGRAIVVFGLVGRYVGPAAAMGLYLINIVVVAIVGWLLKRILPGTGPGLIMEIPPYRQPTIRTLLGKIWLRLREFIVVAWPLLVITSALFALIEALGWTDQLNLGVRFLTWPLGLPAQTGVPLVFGVLRKELSLIMLSQAFGTAQLSAALSQAQMVIFSVFVLFYVPCVATIAALWRELGLRRAAYVLGGTTAIALTTGVLVRGILSWII